MSVSSFANKYLFGPMGLGARLWNDDNQSFSYGGTGLCIGLYDMIEIGNLYLNNGYYNGKQIVSSDWISTMTSFKISTGEVVPFLSDYGYFWWLGKAHGYEFNCAYGYGGQFIFIVKNLNLVVCSRSNYNFILPSKARKNSHDILNIIINQILTSVKE